MRCEAMRAGDVWDSGSGGLSPQVERFLRPRETPELRGAMIVGAHLGALGSVVGLLVLARSTFGLLAAKTLLLTVSRSAGFADGSLGLALFCLMSLGAGIAGGAVFGLVVARLIGKVGSIMSLGAGVTYGLLVWIVGQFVVIAGLAPVTFAVSDQHVVLLAHVLYGAVLGLLPLLCGERRRL